MEKPKKEPKAARGNETFEHGGNKYEIIIPSVHIIGTGKVTALEIATDADLQELLVKSNSGAIRKIV
jgi:hypothetical protein